MMKFKIPQKLRLNNLLNNKKFTVILSIVLAFSLWLGIAMTENPVRDRTFNNLSANITLENTAASDGLNLGIISDVSSHKFSITVSGPNYIVSSLKAEDFTITADTTNIISPGTQSISIIPSCNKSGFSMTVSPSTINIRVDTFDEQSFELVPKLFGAGGSGVEVADELVADTPIFADTQQSTIKIKGPSTELEKISLVRAEATANTTLTTTQTFNADIVLYRAKSSTVESYADDENSDAKFEDKYEEIYRFKSDGYVYDGNKNLITNSYLSLSFTNVKIIQPIVKEKTVACKPVFNNLPGSMSADDVDYTLSYDEVTIKGTPEAVDKIEYISLSPIDFREVSTKSNSFEVTASLPSGVKIDESIEFFTVNINLSGYTETTITVSNIRTTGSGSDLDVTTFNSISVTVCGPRQIIKNIDDDDFYALVDLTDKGVGTHNVEAVIKSDVYKTVWQIGTYTTSVKLS